MKLIPVAVVIIFMIKVIVVKSNDNSSESHDLQNGGNNANTSLSSYHGRTVPGKARKFVAPLENTASTPSNLSRRGQRRNRVSKFQTQHNIPRGTAAPAQRTRRRKVTEARKHMSEPNDVDRAKELSQRSNLIKRRSQSKFNQFGNEAKLKNIEKNNHKTKSSESLENRFQNFTDVNISSESDSDEPKGTEKRLRRKSVKTAASDKVKTIVSAPFKNVNTHRNHKIRDLVKNKKYNPRVERKMIPVLALQKDNGVIIGNQKGTTKSKTIEESSTKKSDMSSEENADHNEFIFIKDDKQKNSTTANTEDEEIVTIDPIILI